MKSSPSSILSFNSGKIGIYGFGALVVTFYKLLRGDYIIGRRNSITTLAFRANPVLRSKKHNSREVEEEDIQGKFSKDLIDSFNKGSLPEVIIIAPNPDQLVDSIADLVDYFKFLTKEHMLHIEKMVPVFVIVSNGIFDRDFREQLRGSLDSSTILDKFSLRVRQEFMDRIIRMTAYQAGKREGTGNKAIYEIMPKGNVIIAGGKASVRERLKIILLERGYPDCEDAGESAERIEFIKAIYNLMANAALLAFIVDEKGEPKQLVTGNILSDSRFYIKEISDFAHRVGEATFNIGKRRKLYLEGEDVDYIFKEHIYPVIKKYEYVPHSSLQLFYQKFKDRQLEERLLPLEENLVSTLVRIAEKEEMREERDVLIQLQVKILNCFHRAIYSVSRT